MLIDKNPQDIKQMFDNISNRYDFLNNIISFGLHKFVKKYVISKLNIKPNDKVLDLCCGSGDLTSIIKKKYPTIDVFGVDFSSKMIEIAKRKNSLIEFREADATNLPFNDNQFDIVTVAFGLRNIKEYNVALNEIKRVLKKGGLFLHLDFESSSKIQKTYDILIIFLLKFVIKNIEPYKYLLKSKKEFFSSNELLKLFQKQGFGVIKHEKMLFNMISYQIVEKN